MKTIRALLALAVLGGALGLSTSSLWAEKVLSKVQIPGTNYCHMKFPAVVPESIGTSVPELQDVNTNDVIDYYGPCDHDPLGRSEIWHQKQQLDESRAGNSGGW